jgi:hypothetical protein
MSFLENKYCVVREALSEETCAIATKYALLKRQIEFAPENIENREKTHAVYSDSLMESILWALHPKIEAVTNLTLFPTYSFYRVYNPGDSLEIHTDRQECEISATLCVGAKYITQTSDYNWSMYVKSSAGQIEQPRCLPGDMVVYRGIDIEHWREPFVAEAGSYQVQVFLHYVDANGSLKHLKYDRRPGLGLPITSRTNLQ